MDDFINDLFLVDFETEYVQFHISKERMESRQAFDYIEGIKKTSVWGLEWELVTSKKLQFWNELNLGVAEIWEDVDKIAKKCRSAGTNGIGIDHYWITFNTNRTGFLEEDFAHVVLMRKKR